MEVTVVEDDPTSYDDDENHAFYYVYLPNNKELSKGKHAGNGNRNVNNK